MKAFEVLVVLAIYALRLLLFIGLGIGKLMCLALQAFTKETLGVTILPPSLFGDMMPDADPRQLVRAIGQIMERDDAGYSRGQ